MLIAPTRPDQASAVSVEFLRDIYASLRTMCDAVIVDTPPGFTPEVIATIDVSTEICMVGMLDSLSLKNTKLGLETLDLMGYETDARLARPQPRRLAGRHHATTTSRRSSGAARTILVPSDREIPRSVNEGTPIVLAQPQSGAARRSGSLADATSKRRERAAAAKRPRQGGLVRLLLGRRR